MKRYQIVITRIDTIPHPKAGIVLNRQYGQSTEYYPDTQDISTQLLLAEISEEQWIACRNKMLEVSQ